MIPKTNVERAEINKILQKIYSLYPSVGAWAKSGKPSPLWNNLQNAQLAMAQYVGPDAQVLFMDSQHIEEVDRQFLRSQSAWNAICVLVECIYHLPCPACPHLRDGLFILEEPNAAA